MKFRRTGVTEKSGERYAHARSPILLSVRPAEKIQEPRRDANRHERTKFKNWSYSRPLVSIRGFLFLDERAARLDTLRDQAVPIVPGSRFKPGFGYQSLNLLTGDPERRSSTAHHVLLHHNGTKIVRAISQGDLTYSRTLSHPGTLDIVEVIQVNA
jgi:hypothetical protein